MSPVDLDRLQFLLTKPTWTAEARIERNDILGDTLLACADEMRSLRAEVTRLGSALLLSDAYVERAAIVAYGRKVEHQIASFDANTAAMLFGFLNEIEHGDHLAAKEKP